MCKNLLSICLVVILMFTLQISTCSGFALHEGVRKIETENWTKTREINEVKSEKKINAEIDLKDGNIEMENEEVQGINQLIKSNVIRNLEDVEKIEPGIVGGKILRTRLMRKDSIYTFNTDSIDSWLRSDTPISWEEDNNGVGIYKWKYNYNSSINGIGAMEWRLLNGEFTLSNEEIELIENKTVSPMLGISTKDGFEMIEPFNGVISILVNSKTTPINYSTNRSDYEMNIDSKKISYKKLVDKSYAKYCTKSYYEELSDHTNNNHIHFNNLVRQTSNIDGQVSQLEGDISKYINKYSNLNTIQLLVGQDHKSGFDNDGGISKLDIFLIDNPKIEVKTIPYIKDRKTNKNIYLDKNYEFTLGQKIYYRFEIKNMSENTNIANLETNTTINKRIEKRKKININKENILIGDNELSEDAKEVKVYINDSDEEEVDGLKVLNEIRVGDKIAIESEDINYTISQEDIHAGEVTLTTDFICNYINAQTFHEVKDIRYQNKVNKDDKNKGEVNILVDIYGYEKLNKDEFYISISNGNEKYNLPVRIGEDRVLKGLEYNTKYEVKIISPMNYEVISTSINQEEDKNNLIIKENSQSSIYIKVKSKQSKVFTTNKKDRLNLEFR